MFPQSAGIYLQNIQCYNTEEHQQLLMSSYPNLPQQISQYMTSYQSDVKWA